MCIKKKKEEGKKEGKKRKVKRLLYESKSASNRARSRILLPP